MGYGMLSGILSGLLGILYEFASLVLEWIYIPIFNIIVVPVIEIVFTVANYVLSLWWYTYSTYLLLIIDFLENLFRVLCGLESDAMSLKFLLFL